MKLYFALFGNLISFPYEPNHSIPFSDICAELRRRIPDKNGWIWSTSQLENFQNPPTEKNLFVNIFVNYPPENRLTPTNITDNRRIIRTIEERTNISIGTQTKRITTKPTFHQPTNIVTCVAKTTTLIRWEYVVVTWVIWRHDVLCRRQDHKVRQQVSEMFLLSDMVKQTSYCRTEHMDREITCRRNTLYL